MTPSGPVVPVTVAVLDNEAAQAVADAAHPKFRQLMTVMNALSSRSSRRPGSVRVVIPTVVRIEAGLDRRARSAAGLGVLRVHDEPLTGARADRAVVLRRAAGGSAVDAAVAQVAEEYADFANVTVLTADLTDLPRLVAVGRHSADIRISRV